MTHLCQTNNNKKPMTRFQKANKRDKERGKRENGRGFEKGSCVSSGIGNIFFLTILLKMLCDFTIVVMVYYFKFIAQVPNWFFLSIKTCKTFFDLIFLCISLICMTSK